MQNIRNCLLSSLCTILAVSGTIAQSPPVVKIDSVRNLKKFRFLGFPVVSYSPETRIGYGAAGIAVFRLGNDVMHTSPSQVCVGIGLTQNKQQLYYANFQLYTNKNLYNIYGEAGYYKYTYYYYGIGEHQIPRELYAADYPRVRVSVLRKWAPHYYAGLRYNYENFVMKDTAAGGELAMGKVPGSRGSASSGVGIVQILDKRDTVLYPTKGYWMELAL